MPKIKICGITNLEDAENAAALGADAIGFIFAKSPRKVTPKIVKDICDALPPFITRVGVFVDEDLEKVNKIAENCGLDAIQLHGHEPPEYCKLVHRRIIKGLRVKKEESLKIRYIFNDDYGRWIGDVRRLKAGIRHFDILFDKKKGKRCGAWRKIELQRGKSNKKSNGNKKKK